MRIFLLALLLAPSLCQDDARVRWLKENAVPLKSIDPADTEFKDLEPLRELIGKARVVQLGEQTHGDGATFFAKTRLIKFLHEKMGFDVLAFESGLYDCRKAWESFRAGDDPLKAAQKGIFAIWTHSEEVQPLIRYLGERAKADRPLELAGFDCQFTARASGESLIPDLKAVCGKISLDETLRSDLVATVELMLSGEPPSGPVPEKAKMAFDSFHAACSSEKGSKALGAEASFWKQMSDSLRAQADNHGSERGPRPESSNLRDRQMADNLVWLARERYAGRKIIVWAATFHLMRNAPSIALKGVDYSKTVTMGHLVAKQLGPDVFTLGFTAYEGRAGLRGNPYRLAPAAAGSLEDLCVKAGLENAVFSFKSGKWPGGKIDSRPLGNATATADWSQVVDGMVFTRRMVPSTMSETYEVAIEPGKEEEARDLLGTLDKAMSEVEVRRTRNNPWINKLTFAAEFAKWKLAAKPDDAAVAAMEKRVGEWRDKHAGNAAAAWRADQLLAEFAVHRKDFATAGTVLDRAIAAYTEGASRDPAKLSFFHHLVNQRAMVTWHEKGPDAAIEFAAGLLEKDKRMGYFHATPWDARFNRELRLDGMDKLISRMKKAYAQRAKAFPDLAAQAERYAEGLK